MPRTLTHPQPNAFTHRPTPATWPLHWLAILRLWQQRARTRRQLAQLDLRLLSDSGISLAERDSELAKPFWR